MIMAATFQVNINIMAGVDFTQEFTINNADMTPTDITAFNFFAKLAKHEGALNADTSTSDNLVYKAMPFATTITNGVGGVYEISLTAEQTQKLEEGKYVYSVVMQDGGGAYSEVVSGLAFVNIAFGYMASGTVESL